MTNVFICYRREDSWDHTDTIATVLPRVFWKRFKVFQDVTSISGGIEWKAYIERHIARSNAVLVIIGPQWVSVADSDERRRLESSADPVRQEIEAALRLRIPIIPVLVGGAAMPDESQLPESLKRLADFQAVTVRRKPDLDADVENLRVAIQRQRTTRVRRWRAAVETSAKSGARSLRRSARQPAMRALAGVALILALGGTTAWQYRTLAQAPERLIPTPTVTSTATTAITSCGVTSAPETKVITITDPAGVLHGDSAAVAQFQAQVREAFLDNQGRTGIVTVFAGGSNVSQGIAIAHAAISAIRSTSTGTEQIFGTYTYYESPEWTSSLSANEVEVEVLWYAPC